MLQNIKTQSMQKSPELT